MKLSHLARAAACALSSIVAANAASAKQLWTVDDDAPADFAVIQDAVNAAANGDVIVVRPGNYAGFQITGKSVAVIGDAITKPNLQSAVTIAQTAAGQVVVLAQLTQSITPFGSAHGLTLNSCVGPVRIENCTFRGQRGGPPGVGARITSSADVIFSAGNLIGGEGVQSGTPSYATSYGGGHGCDALASQLALYQTILDAGVPGTTNSGVHIVDGTRGGAGLRIDGSFEFSAQARMAAGQGGCHSLSTFLCTNSDPYGTCGDGGFGLWLVGGASNVNVMKPDLYAGAAGVTNCSNAGYVEYGHPGAAFKREAPGSIAKRVNGEPRTLSAPALVSGTTTVGFTATGVTGDLVYVVVEPTPHFQYDAALHGVWSLSYPPAPSSTPDAVVGATGSVSFQLTLPALSPGQEAQTWFVQPYVVDTSAQTFAGTPRSVTLAQ